MNNPEINWAKIAKEYPEGLKKWLIHLYPDIQGYEIENSTVILHYPGNDHRSKTWFDALDKKALECMTWLDGQGVHVNAAAILYADKTEWYYSIITRGKGEHIGEQPNEYPDRNHAIAASILTAFKLLKSSVVEPENKIGHDLTPDESC